jgi:hypothetical protein
VLLDITDRSKKTLQVVLGSPVHDELAVRLSDAAMRGVDVQVLYDLTRLRRWMQAQTEVLATRPATSGAADRAVANLKRWRAIKGMWRTAHVQFAGATEAVRHTRLVIADEAVLALGGFDLSHPTGFEAFVVVHAPRRAARAPHEAAAYFASLWAQRSEEFE